MEIVKPSNLAVGDVIRFVRDNPGGMQDITLERLYVINGHDSDGTPYFYDDAGDKDFAADAFLGQFEVVQKAAQ